MIFHCLYFYFTYKSIYWLDNVIALFSVGDVSTDMDVNHSDSEWHTRSHSIMRRTRFVTSIDYWPKGYFNTLLVLVSGFMLIFINRFDKISGILVIHKLHWNQSSALERPRQKSKHFTWSISSKYFTWSRLSKYFTWSRWSRLLKIIIFYFSKFNFRYFYEWKSFFKDFIYIKNQFS